MIFDICSVHIINSRISRTSDIARNTIEGRLILVRKTSVFYLFGEALLKCEFIFQIFPGEPACDGLLYESPGGSQVDGLPPASKYWCRCVRRRDGSATKHTFSNADEFLTQIYLPFRILWVHSLICYLNFIFPEFQQKWLTKILSTETFLSNIKKILFITFLCKLLD